MGSRQSISDRMRWLVLVRWNFRGENKTGLIIHAKDQREAEERVYTILPSTFFRAGNREIVIVPTHKMLETLPAFIQDLTPCPQAENQSSQALSETAALTP